MKKILGLIMFAIIATTFTSCNPDPCEKVICNNNGTCNEGVCSCEAGYEGETCDILSRTKTVSDWNVEEDGSLSAADNYDVTITANSNDAKAIYIGNMYNAFSNAVNATVNGNVITIDRQEPDGDGYFVRGTGTIDESVTPNRINFEYTVTNENDPLNIITDNFGGAAAGTYSEWDRK